jgi:hypothetical protein
MMLKGKIRKYEVIVLIDSGSSTSFISRGLASKLHDAQTLSKLIRVKVADGKILEGTKMFPACEWKC